MGSIALFQRCAQRNVLLQSTRKEMISDRLLPKTKQYFDEFCRLPGVRFEFTGKAHSIGACNGSLWGRDTNESQSLLGGDEPSASGLQLVEDLASLVRVERLDGVRD